MDAQKAQEAGLQQAEQAQAAQVPPVQQAPPVPDFQQAQAPPPQQAQADPIQQPDPVQQPNQSQKAAPVQPDLPLPSTAKYAANPLLAPVQPPNPAANPFLIPPPPNAPPNALNSPSASDPRFWDPSSGSNNFNDWRDGQQNDGISNRESIRNVRSGSANPSINISNTGDNVNMCLGLQQVANTGNVANQQGLSQYNSDTGDVGFEGSGIDITPDLTVECNQTIVQAAAAGDPLAQAAVQSGAVAAPALASASASAPPMVAAVASGGGAVGPSVGLPVARGAGLAQLPSTGGLMTLPLAVLGLSGLGGGLMFWRLRR